MLYGLEAPPEFGVTAPQVYAEALEQIAFADQRGVDDVWMTEHHFFEDDYCPSPLIVCAAAAARTERIRICQGIVVSPLYGHPLKLAEDAAVIDNISNGRFELGLGQGYRQDEFDGFGLPFDRKLGMFVEGLDVIERAFTGERFSYEGRYYNVLDARLRPSPVQRPIPIWIGAATPASRRRVARRGHNLLISLLTDLEHTRGQFADYRVALTEAGRDPASEPTALIREFYVAADDETAWREVRPHLMHTYKKVYAPPAVSLVERLADGRRRQVTSVDDPYYDSDAFWQDRMIIGGPERCASEICRWRDQLGVDTLVLRMQHPGQPHDQVMRCIELLTGTVMPMVEATPPNRVTP